MLSPQQKRCCSEQGYVKVDRLLGVTNRENWLTCGTVLFLAGDPLLVGVHANMGMVAHFDYVRVLGKGDD